MWLVALVVFLLAAVLLLMDNSAWRLTAVIGVVVSVPLVAMWWAGAPMGAIGERARACSGVLRAEAQRCRPVMISRTNHRQARGSQETTGWAKGPLCTGRLPHRSPWQAR
jgi:hypothetical protein